MREKLARVGYIANVTSFDFTEDQAIQDWDQESDECKNVYQAIADAILAALYDPTPEVLEAGECPLHWIDIRGGLAFNIWQAMIDKVREV